jgi:hypothetical protein
MYASALGSLPAASLANQGTAVHRDSAAAWNFANDCKSDRLRDFPGQILLDNNPRRDISSAGRHRRPANSRSSFPAGTGGLRIHRGPLPRSRHSDCPTASDLIMPARPATKPFSLSEHGLLRFGPSPERPRFADTRTTSPPDRLRGAVTLPHCHRHGEFRSRALSTLGLYSACTKVS